MATLVSGRWARGSSRYTIPDLCLRAPPSLSCRTSHIWPSRPSREGFGVGLQVRGEERLDPELFTLKSLAVKSCLRSGTAGLYRPGNLHSSRPKGNAEFSLTVEMGGCVRD